MDSEDLRLIEPDPALKPSFIELMDDFARAGDPRYEPFRALVHRDFAAVLADWKRAEQGEGQAGGPTPYRNYWLVRNGGDILGTIRLRLRLNRELLAEGGHVGYNIRPSERNKGYATKMLAMALDKFRDIGGYDRVLVTCDDDNAASARVIEKNGGARDSDAVSPWSGKRVRRYWIAL